MKELRGSHAEGMLDGFSDAELDIAERARTLASAYLAPAAQEIDQAGRFPDAEVREAAERGLCGVDVPTALGGCEAGGVAFALCVLEIAKSCASTATLVMLSNVVAELIARHGTPVQKTRYVPRITSGAWLAASLAVCEPDAGSDGGAIRTTARASERGFLLNGSKVWVTAGAHAGVIVVWARTGFDERSEGWDGISALLVERDTKGMRFGAPRATIGLHGAPSVPIEFVDCWVPSDALLGPLGGGHAIATDALAIQRIGVAAQAIGIGRAALEDASLFASNRRQFGESIARFQALQWMLADSRTEMDAAYLLCVRAARRKALALPFSTEAAMAKLLASEAAGRSCDRCLQILGAEGYTLDGSASRRWRDARATRIYQETSEMQRALIARDLLAGAGAPSGRRA